MDGPGGGPGLSPTGPVHVPGPARGTGVRAPAPRRPPEGPAAASTPAASPGGASPAHRTPPDDPATEQAPARGAPEPGAGRRCRAQETRHERRAGRRTRARRTPCGHPGPGCVGHPADAPHLRRARRTDTGPRRKTCPEACTSPPARGTGHRIRTEVAGRTLRTRRESPDGRRTPGRESPCGRSGRESRCRTPDPDAGPYAGRRPKRSGTGRRDAVRTPRPRRESTSGRLAPGWVSPRERPGPGRVVVADVPYPGVPRKAAPSMAACSRHPFTHPMTVRSNPSPSSTKSSREAAPSPGSVFRPSI